MDENTTTPAPPSDPTLDDTTDAIPTDSKDAAKAVTDALGDSIVPDRIQAREPAPEEPPKEETSQAEETPEPTSETLAPTTEEAPPAETPAEEEPEEYIPPAQPVSPIDAKAFVDENGYVDVNKLTDAINQTVSGVQQTASAAAQREVAAQRSEEKQWNQAIEKFPQLKTDRTLRDFVQQARIGKTTEAYRNASSNPEALKAIKIPTPTQIASELFKRMGQAKTEGIQAATETTTVAEQVKLETASTPVQSTSKREELFKNIRNPNREQAEKAQTELLKDLLFAEK